MTPLLLAAIRPRLTPMQFIQIKRALDESADRRDYIVRLGDELTRERAARKQCEDALRKADQQAFIDYKKRRKL